MASTADPATARDKPAGPPAAVRPHGLTARGAATRQRIVAAAAGLIFERGVADTTVEHVRAAANVSGSQIYHYFADKAELVRAVIDYQTDVVVGGQEDYLHGLDTPEGLRRWRDMIVAGQQSLDCRGCAIGSLASEIAETDPALRQAAAASLHRWESGIRAGLTAMQAGGRLRDGVDPHDLATAVLATLQGGLFLTQIQRTTRPLEVALDAMIAYICGNMVPAPAGSPAHPPESARATRVSPRRYRG